jgi:acylphosphatase
VSRSGDGAARLHARIEGRVQGVFFRASTQRRARALGLRGWVRNLADGAVELVAEGGREDCEALLEYCREGPAAAQVTSVESAWQTATGEYRDFAVRH